MAARYISTSQPIQTHYVKIEYSASIQKPKISVILPAYNSAKTICQQLEALAKQDTSEHWELVVVDDCSTDETTKVVIGMQDLFPYNKLISTPRQGGAALARNWGARNACGELLLFCDADDIVAVDWISEMNKSLRNEVAAVGGQIDEYALNDARHLAWRPPLMTKGLPIGWWYLPYALTGNFGIKADIFWALGGFDETLRNGIDVDFSWRLQLIGEKLEFAPNAIVFVRHRQDLLSSMRQAYNWGAVSVELVRRFHRDGMDAPRISPARIRLLALATHLFEVLKGEIPQAAWLRQCAYEWGIVVGYLHSKIFFRARASSGH